MLCSLKRLRIVIYFAVKEAPGYPARPPDARSCEARRAKVAASASVLTGFPSPLGQGAFSGRKGRTSCCRGELRLPGLVLGARSLPGRNEGGDGPESRGDPQPPAAPGPAVERSRALQPNLFPEVEGPPGGSAQEQPHGDPRPGVAEINRAARGGQASPFFRLLADAPDIVARRSLVWLPGLQAIQEVGRPFLPSLPFRECEPGAAVSSAWAGFPGTCAVGSPRPLQRPASARRIAQPPQLGRLAGNRRETPTRRSPSWFCGDCT